MACSSEGVSMVTSLKCWRKSMFPGRMVKGNVDKEGKFRLFNQSGMLLAWSLSLSSSCFQVLLLLVGELTGGEKQWSNPGCFCLSFEPGGAKTYIARQKLQIINLDFPLLLGTCPKTKGNLSNVEPPINFCKMFSSSLKVSENCKCKAYGGPHAFQVRQAVTSFEIVKGFWCYLKIDPPDFVNNFLMIFWCLIADYLHHEVEETQDKAELSQPTDAQATMKEADDLQKDHPRSA
ncbi:hypothetical protein V6N12_060919 [Hibiscus sabdariffa]|uniref:Uncharacterized protein n=1 Tax=Hibiscus sabdariffa TaxID=183260 RepID=A0ABR2DVI9_9ROSI